MEQFNVKGMSCAACSARVEKAVSKVPGVTACTVSLLTNSMGVEGSASAESIICAVQKAGYKASVKKPHDAASRAKQGGTAQAGAGRTKAGNAAERAAAGSAAYADEEAALADTETPLLKKRLIASIGFLLVLMYVSMGHMMWSWPIPAWLAGNHVAMGLLQLLLTAVIMVINQKFFISGFTGLWHRAPNMDTLVALGASAAFGWSVVALFLMTDAQVKGDMAQVMVYMNEFYFESAAMILTLITVGKMLEARAKGRTTDALKGLMRLAPETATLLRDGKEVTVPVAEVVKDDIFVVRPGESIPVDGIILEGSTSVNEAALTGESIPVDKEAGAQVSAATINQSGFIRCRASRVGEDTTLSQIIQMVSDAAATKAPIAKTADRVSGVFVPVVMGISLVTLLVWLLIGQGFAYALARAISVLVISCPCALGLATPVAIMVGSGVGAKNGILFKTAASLEETGKTKVVALDKTGTITRGEPQVTDIVPAEGVTAAELLRKAAALEAKSEHPLARAVMEYARQQKIEPAEVSAFTALPGSGLTAMLDDKQLLGGSMNWIGAQTRDAAAGSERLTEQTGVLADANKALLMQAECFAEAGKTPLLFMEDGKLLGIIAVADTIKEDSAAAIRDLRNLGLRVVMLTGDNEKTAAAIGAQAGVDEVIAGVLPDGKERVIRDLKKYGQVMMVGDGINDAPALTSADIGAAVGAGADIALDAAELVLMKNSLTDVAAAIRLSRQTLRNIHENLFWAFFYNTIGIPVAAGVFVALGLTLNPMLGAAAMSLSSFCVVTNALRLNLCRPYDNRKDHKHSKAERA